MKNVPRQIFYFFFDDVLKMNFEAVSIFNHLFLEFYASKINKNEQKLLIKQKT